MSLDIDFIKKKMEEYIGSEEHMKYCSKMKHRKKLEKRNIENIHNMSIEDRCAFIQKVYDKYTSQTYKDRELKAGYYEQRCSLYDVIFEYAIVYGKPSLYKMNGYFTEEQYDIDGKFVIGLINGQGSSMYITPISNEDIIPHDIKNFEISIHYPNDELLIYTDNTLVFNDIRLQIKNKKLTGFYVIFNDKKYEINSDGTINNWPKGLFDIEIHQLANLIK